MNRTTFTVDELVKKYSSGKIAIPEIQREFVWDAKKIRLLLDSIYKDYPSGAIILWQPKLKNAEYEMLIRPERLHLYKDNLPEYLLLDGQQRLTALSSVLLHEDKVRTSLGEEIQLPNIFINIKTLELEARKGLEPGSSNQVLLNKVMSQESDDSGLNWLFNELRNRKGITHKHQNNLTEFREKILRYSYPVQILMDCEYRTVADIFKRVNSQGKPLVTAELELASIVPHWKGVSKKLRDFIKQMRDKNFNADLSFYIRCLAIVSSDSPRMDQFTRDIMNEEYSIPQLERNWNLTKRAITKLQKIFERNHVSRTELITTRNAIVPLVYALARDKKGRMPEGLLIKYLIYAMIGGHYEQQSDKVLIKDVAPLRDSLPRIEGGFKKLYRSMVNSHFVYKGFDKYEFRGIAAKNPYMLLMYLCLAANKAKDFGDKRSVFVTGLEKYQIHHIFPMEFMQESEEAERYRKRKKISKLEFKQQINDIANLTFISVGANQQIKKRAPSEYLPLMCDRRNLEAHCIPKEKELWSPRNFDKFCAERRRLLARSMNQYIKSLDE